jgi:hypothetical protein
MTHIPGSDRSQLLLLPEAINDYVAPTIRFASSTLSSTGLI